MPSHLPNVVTSAASSPVASHVRARPPRHTSPGIFEPSSPRIVTCEHFITGHFPRHASDVMMNGEYNIRLLAYGQFTIRILHRSYRRHRIRRQTGDSHFTSEPPSAGCTPRLQLLNNFRQERAEMKEIHFPECLRHEPRLLSSPFRDIALFELTETIGTSAIISTYDCRRASLYTNICFLYSPSSPSQPFTSFIYFDFSIEYCIFEHLPTEPPQ